MAMSSATCDPFGTSVPARSETVNKATPSLGGMSQIGALFSIAKRTLLLGLCLGFVSGCRSSCMRWEGGWRGRDWGLMSCLTHPATETR